MRRQLSRTPVAVVEAAGLLSGDANGLSDPYAMVLLDGEKWFTTKVIQRTLVGAPLALGRGLVRDCCAPPASERYRSGNS